MEMGNAKKTALYDAHVQCGGKLIEFAGWMLPVEYAGLTREHEAVRNRAGMFDVSHMGEVLVTGPQAEAFVNNLVTNDVAGMEPFQVIYCMMCYPDGGVVDDLLVYKYDIQRYLLVINASNVDKDFAWMQEQSTGFQVTLENRSPVVSEVAVQGPMAQPVVQKLTQMDLDQIGFFRFRDEVLIAGVPCLISRTGYTGEDGFEIYADAAGIVTVWNAVLEAGKPEGLEPCGLGCRDTLRFEAALPLYGNEISQDITPLEAGLGIFVKLDREAFIGRQALIDQKTAGLKQKVVGFELKEKSIPRHGYDVKADGRVIGHVTTGYISPTLGKPIGMALVDAAYSALGTGFTVQIRQKEFPAVVISKKFLEKKYKK